MALEVVSVSTDSASSAKRSMLSVVLGMRLEAGKKVRETK